VPDRCPASGILRAIYIAANFASAATVLDFSVPFITRAPLPDDPSLDR
jgi:hypothetical protein